MTRLRSVLFLVCGLLMLTSIFALAQLAKATQRAQDTYTTYLPIATKAQPAPQAESFPASLSLPTPFTVLDSAPINPIYMDGVWYVTVYRVDSGSLNGGWGLAILPDRTVVALGQVSQSDGREATLPPLDEAATRALQVSQRYCSSRIDQQIAPDGNYYVWCAPSATGRSRQLLIQRGLKVP